MTVEILGNTTLDDGVKTKNNIRIMFKAKPSPSGVGHVHSFLREESRVVQKAFLSAAGVSLMHPFRQRRPQSSHLYLRNQVK